MTGPVSHRVALCGDFPGEVRETPDDTNLREIWAVSGRNRDGPVRWQDGRTGELFDRVEKQAGERDGVAYAPPPRPTADGNADRFKAFQAFRAHIFFGVVKPPTCLPSGLYSAGFACRSGKEKALPPALQRFWKEWNHV